MITPEIEEKAQGLVDRYPVARSALLPLLHLVQHAEGYVSDEGVALAAGLLGLTKAEVAAVSTFYTMYKREPLGRHLVSVCTNFSCKVRGAQEVYDALKAHLGGIGHRDHRGRRDHAGARGVPGQLRGRPGGQRRLPQLRDARCRGRDRAGRPGARRHRPAPHARARLAGHPRDPAPPRRHRPAGPRRPRPAPGPGHEGGRRRPPARLRPRRPLRRSVRADHQDEAPLSPADPRTDDDADGAQA